MNVKRIVALLMCICALLGLVCNASAAERRERTPEEKAALQAEIDKINADAEEQNKKLLKEIERRNKKLYAASDRAKKAAAKSFEDRLATPQPYGLPDSYCPEKIAQAAADAVETLPEYLRMDMALSVVGSRITSAEKVEPLGGYQYWTFGSKENVLASDGSDIVDVMCLMSNWFFILYIDERPACTFVISESADGTTQLSSAHSRSYVTANALTEFARLSANKTAASPVFLSFLAGDGASLVTAKFADGDFAYLSYFPEYGLIESTMIIGYEQQELKNANPNPFVMGGGGGGFFNFAPTPAEADPSYAQTERQGISAVVVVCAAAGVIGCCGAFILYRRKCVRSKTMQSDSNRPE